MARHLATRNPLRIGTGEDRRSATGRSKAVFLLLACYTQEENAANACLSSAGPPLLQRSRPAGMRLVS